MTRKTLLFAFMALPIGAFTGCGEAPVMVDKGGKLGDLKIIPTSPASGSAGAGPVKDPKVEISELRTAMTATFAKNNNIRADVTGYIKNVQSGKIFSNRMDYWFQKPNSTALYMRECSDPAVTGTKIVWMGGKEVAIKTKFIGFWVKTSIAETDERLKDVRGDRLSETAVPAMMKTILDPQAEVAILGRGQFKGRPVVQLSLKSKNMLARVTNEKITVDTGWMLPVVREMYEGTQLTYRIQLEGLKLNVHEPKAFVIE